MRLENRQDRTDQQFEEHDESFKHHDTLIEKNAELIRQWREKHDETMEALKIMNDIAMASFLRDQGEMVKVVRIENQYVRDFSRLFQPRKKQQPLDQPRRLSPANKTR